MTEIFVVGCILAAILLIWFKTEAWYEYTKVFGLGFLSRAKKYEAEKHEDVTMTYMKFLKKNYHKLFGIRLITCEICFSVWASIILSFVAAGSVLYAPALMIIGLTAYGIICKLLDI